MKAHHFEPDLNIFEKLMAVALHMKFDPQFALSVLRELERKELVTSERFRQTVERGIEILENICARPRNSYFASGEFRGGCVNFKEAYREYLLREQREVTEGEKLNLITSQSIDEVQKAVNAKLCINILRRREAKVTPRSSSS